MLRTNLSTRPFYNERAIHLLLALAAVLVLALTAYNALRIISLSRQNTEFSTLINRDRAEAQRLNAEARKIRAGINQAELQATAAAAAEANRLIERRTFSWTEFFNLIEETLPPDVMLTMVQPLEAGASVSMAVLARRPEDVDEFIEKLEATGRFSSVLPVQEDLNDAGLYRVQLRTRYDPAGDADAPSEAAGTPATPVEGAGPETTAPAGTAPPAAPAVAPAGTAEKGGRGR